MAKNDRRKGVEEMVEAARQRNSYFGNSEMQYELYMAQSYLNGMGRMLYLITGHEVELRVTPEGVITKIVYIGKEYEV